MQNKTTKTPICDYLSKLLKEVNSYDDKISANKHPITNFNKQSLNIENNNKLEFELSNINENFWTKINSYNILLTPYKYSLKPLSEDNYNTEKTSISELISSVTSSMNTEEIKNIKNKI